MTNDESARALGEWVRERASRAELSESARAWLAGGPSGDERPPASVLAELVVALTVPGASRVIDPGALDGLADEADEAMLVALRRLSEAYASDGGQGRMS